MEITKFSTFCVKADYYAEFIPGISTVTNLIDLFLKYVVLPRLSSETLKKSHYFSYLDNAKAPARYIVALIPVLGNGFLLLIEILAAKDAGKFMADAEQSGTGIQKAKIYKQAANAGSIEGMYRYGSCCEKGIDGAKKNTEKAEFAYRYAAIWGHPQAQKALARL